MDMFMGTSATTLLELLSRGTYGNVNVDLVPFMVQNEDFVDNHNVGSNLEETNVELLEFDEIEYEEAPHKDFSDPTHFENVDNSQYLSAKYGSRDYQLYKGQDFADKDKLIHYVTRYAVSVNQTHKVVKSSKTLWYAKCDKCNWLLRAHIISGEKRFRITYYGGSHTCLNHNINRDHLNLGSNFIAREIEELVKAQFSINVAAIVAHVSVTYNFQISYKKAWVAKQKAIKNLFGGWKESYKILPRWLDEAVKANPGTVVVWRKETRDNPGEQFFQSVFWSFAPSISAFKHCRPVISVDGTHLYGKYKGTLLVIVAVDGDDKILPIAFAIVDKENIDTWTWFMACFRERVCPRRKLCVISDRHIGIRTAMMSDGWAPPQAFHRFCLRHMASNFQTKFKDVHLKNAIHGAALENQLCKFNERMESIGSINQQAKEWWESVPLENWALSHDSGRRFGVTTTNLSESFNNVLKGARSLPITALVQLTFYRLNKYFDVRRRSCEKKQSDGKIWTDMVTEKLNHYAESSNRHHVETFDHQQGVFSVITGYRLNMGNVYKGGHTHKVNLKDKVCSCKKWQLYGIPCSHVLAACGSRNIDFEPFLKRWYKLSALENVYAPKFHPIPDKRYWDSYHGDEIVPNPNMKRLKGGRPPSTRLKNEMDVKEKGVANRCSTCKEVGHNSRNCPVVKKRKADVLQNEGSF